MNYFTLADVPRREPSIGHGGKLHGNRRPFALEMTWARYALMVGREHLGEKTFGDVELACRTFDYEAKQIQHGKNTHEYVDALVFAAEKLKATIKEILHRCVWCVDFGISYRTLMDSKVKDSTIRENFACMPNIPALRAVANALYKTDYKIVAGEHGDKNPRPTMRRSIKWDTIKRTHWTTIFSPNDLDSLVVIPIVYDN